ncbi:hypothetical protein C8A03DRAFT_29719 [Achaetomium macrosporum]|uniref:Glycine zipper 2TM domain-containing protein n=1 Tax=Achaetomium macrosporum TaxID=79813 RepID=A0AAN7HIW2_9PEZI|nr:hypothetical protein C8A03DRAFT_29719 [Achaetomium macrosporum]
MPRYHSDSESDYSPPRRRSPTPGPRRVRDMPPDHRPRFPQYDGPTPFYPPPAPMASGAAGPGPAKRSARGPPPTDTEPTTIMPRRNRDRDRDRERGTRGRRYSSASASDNSRNNSPSRSRSRSRSRSPLGKARALLASTFTPSTSGLGAGVLGAIVGGLAAAEVSEHHHHRHHHHHHHSDSRERERHRLLSTVVGAAVGGLGANAIEKRLEAGSKERKGERTGGGEVGRYREDNSRCRDDGVVGKGSRERGDGDWVRY